MCESITSSFINSRMFKTSFSLLFSNFLNPRLANPLFSCAMCLFFGRSQLQRKRQYSVYIVIIIDHELFFLLKLMCVQKRICCKNKFFKTGFSVCPIDLYNQTLDFISLSLLRTIYCFFLKLYRQDHPRRFYITVYQTFMIVSHQSQKYSLIKTVYFEQ